MLIGYHQNQQKHLLIPPHHPNKILWQAGLAPFEDFLRLQSGADALLAFPINNIHFSFPFFLLPINTIFVSIVLWIVLCRISILYLPSKGCIFFENRIAKLQQRNNEVSPGCDIPVQNKFVTFSFCPRRIVSRRERKKRFSR